MKYTKNVLLALACLAFYGTLQAVNAVAPGKPTLEIQGTTAIGDLSLGADYTFLCTSVPAGATFEFLKGVTALASGTLTAVTGAATDGAYTCTSTNAGSETSPASDPITLTVGAAGKLCTAANVATDCTGTPYAGTCTSDRCDCAADYEANKAVCIEKALTVAPTLKIKDDTTALGDLSKGAEYTLVCTTTPVGKTTKFFKDNVEITSAKLTSVSTTNTNGAYTCKATNTRGDSPVSNIIPVTVGAAGKKCQASTDCKNVANAKEECTTNRCTCKSGYKPEKAKCNAAVPMATFSVITFITAFIASKLV